VLYAFTTITLRERTGFLSEERRGEFVTPSRVMLHPLVTQLSDVIETLFRCLPHIFWGQDFDGATSDNVRRDVMLGFKMAATISVWLGKRLYLWLCAGQLSFHF